MGSGMDLSSPIAGNDTHELLLPSYVSSEGIEVNLLILYLNLFSRVQCTGSR